MSKNADTSLMIGFAYENSEGEVTNRMVKFRHIEPNNGHLYLTGFCHLAWQVRTFRIDRIIDTVTDIETGEIMEVEAWLKRVMDDVSLDAISLKSASPDTHPQDNNASEYAEFFVRKRKPRTATTEKHSFSRPVQTGKGVHFTGFKAADKATLEALVSQIGWHVRPKMSPTVDIVVAGYNAGPKKIQQAINSGIAIITAKVFREMCVTAQKSENEE